MLSMSRCSEWLDVGVELDGNNVVIISVAVKPMTMALRRLVIVMGYP